MSANRSGPEWAGRLHVAVGAMALENPDLAFATSLLTQALNHGGLTDRQTRYATRICDRYPGRPADPGIDLAQIPCSGRA